MDGGRRNRKAELVASAWDSRPGSTTRGKYFALFLLAVRVRGCHASPVRLTEEKAVRPPDSMCALAAIPYFWFEQPMGGPLHPERHERESTIFQEYKLPIF